MFSITFYFKRLLVMLQFFNKSFGLYRHLTVLALSFACLVLFLFSPLRPDFFVGRNTVKPSHKVCRFVYVNSSTKIDEIKKNIEQSFTDTDHYIDKHTYDYVLNRIDRELLKVDECDISNFNKLKLDSSGNSVRITTNTSHISKIKYVDLYNPKIFFPEEASNEWENDDQDVQLVQKTQMLIPKLLFKKKIMIITNTLLFNSDVLNHFYLAHLDVIIRLAIVIFAFTISPIVNMFILRRDLKTRFIDTIQTKGLSLLQYILHQFVWSFLATQLPLMVLTTAALMIEINFDYSVVFFSALIIGLVLLSYDIHISTTVSIFTVDHTNALALFVSVLTPTSYLIIVSFFDRRISLEAYLYPGLDSIVTFVSLFSVPGTCFSKLILLLIDYSSTQKNLVYSIYSIEPPSMPYIFGFLLLYVAVLVFKTAYCLFVFRLRWDNIYDRIGPQSYSPIKWLSRKRKKNGKTNRKFGSFSGTPDRRSSPRGGTDISKEFVPDFAALMMKNVYKQVPGGSSSLQNLSLTLKYHSITVFYSVSEFECMSAVCKLCARFSQPDSGTVNWFNFNERIPARVAFILTRGFHFETLTVGEYLYFFGRIQSGADQSDVVFDSMIPRLLDYLNLRDFEHKKASELSELEQIKLSIAFALLGRSNVLLFDNPSITLIQDEKKELWDLFIRLKANRAVFVATNSIEEVDFIANQVYIFSNSRVHFSGTTGELKGQVKERFLLRISRKSKMTGDDIEELFRACSVSFVPKQSTLSELVYAFDCKDDTQKGALMKMLDQLQQKSEKDDIVVNSISMNTLGDVLAAKLIGTSKRKDPTKVKKVKVIVNSSLTNRPNQMNFCIHFSAMVWKLFMMRSHNLLVVVVMPFVVNFMHDFMPYICAYFLLQAHHQYFASTDTALRNVRVSLSNTSQQTAFKPNLEPYCNQFTSLSHDAASCQILRSNSSYLEWIYRNAKTFMEYSQEYLVSFNVDQRSENLFVVNAFFNTYSRLPRRFAAAHFLNYLLNMALGVDIKFDINMQSVSLAGSDIFEALVSMFFFSNSILIVTFFGLLFIKSESERERSSGFMFMQQSNGVHVFPLYLARCFMGLFVGVATFLPSYFIMHMLLENPYWMALSFTNFAIYVAFYFLTVFNLISHIEFTSSYIGFFSNYFFILGHLLAINVIFLLAMSRSYWSPFWYILLIEVLLFVFPFLPYVFFIQSLFVEMYDFSDSIPSGTNLKTHYEHFWKMPFYRYYLQLLTPAIFYMFVHFKGDYWHYLRYRYFEQRKMFVRTIMNREKTVIDEMCHVRSILESGEMPKDVVLVVHELAKLGQHKIIEQLSFTVARGECFAILGMKGAGKSEILRILCGRSFYDEGEFHFGYIQQKGSRMDETFYQKRFNGIAFAPQFNCFIDTLTVKEMLILFCKIRSIKTEDIMTEVRRMGEIFKLTRAMNKISSVLSDFDQRKLTLAMAFIGGPKLVLVDEPTHQVEFTSKHEVWDMIMAAKTVYGSSVLLTSTQLSEVEALADRISILIQGGIRYLGSEEKLRKRSCKGIQISLKLKPANCADVSNHHKVRTKVAQWLPDIRALNMHKYHMQYYIRQGDRQQPAKWSTVFDRLEKLRVDFDLETYTITIAGLEQIFYIFSKKYRNAIQ